MLWHIYYPQLSEIYIVFIVPTMFICSRRVTSKRSTMAGTNSECGVLHRGGAVSRRRLRVDDR